VRLTDLLKSSPLGFTMQQLVDQLGVSPRTVFRDLHLLREAGVCAGFDPRRRAVTAKPRLPPGITTLSAEHAIVLALAARTSVLNTHRPIGLAIDRAITALLAKLPEESRARTIRLLATCLLEIGDARAEGPREQVTSKLMQAIGLEQPVRLWYRPTNNPQVVMQTKVSQCQFTVSPGSWQLLGWSSFHRAWRRFDLCHIESVEPLDETCPSSRGPKRPWQTPCA
jgi:predicted DNA-binding transcriptional regulator YafY